MAKGFLWKQKQKNFLTSDIPLDFTSLQVIFVSK